MRFISTEYEDVRSFMAKMGHVLPDTPRPVAEALEADPGRLRQLCEEMGEIKDAVRDHDLAKVADGLVDLAYFIYGFAALLGLPWEELWTEVHRANLEKKPGATERSPMDAIKPPGWRPPNIQGVLDRTKL